MMRFALVLLVAAATLAGLPGDASAQQRRRLKLDGDIVIRAEVMRPQLVVLLSRKRAAFDTLERDVDFQKAILKSIEDRPFRDR